MDHHHNHGDLAQGFYTEQKEIFDASPQGMYVFFDDDTRVCNDIFATMLGYASSKEWSTLKIDTSFPDVFVAEKSQQELVDAYQKAMENGAAATVNVSWKKKSGGTIDTTVILVPILYQGHALALHFVSQG